MTGADIYIAVADSLGMSIWHQEELARFQPNRNSIPPVQYLTWPLRVIYIYSTLFLSRNAKISGLVFTESFSGNDVRLSVIDALTLRFLLSKKKKNS